MRWKSGITICSLGVLGFAALQVVPSSPQTNPPVVKEHTLHGRTTVPPAVSASLRRACMNCHSNETRWPWYSRIAPLSWAMTGDVLKARKAMNFSEWSDRPAKAIGSLTAICADISSGRMPLSRYLVLHPEARLSASEKETICAWTRQETERQMQIRRKSLISKRIP